MKARVHPNYIHPSRVTVPGAAADSDRPRYPEPVARSNTKGSTARRGRSFSGVTLCRCRCGDEFRNDIGGYWAHVHGCDDAPKMDTTYRRRKRVRRKKNGR